METHETAMFGSMDINNNKHNSYTIDDNDNSSFISNNEINNVFPFDNTFNMSESIQYQGPEFYHSTESGQYASAERKTNTRNSRKINKKKS